MTKVTDVEIKRIDLHPDLVRLIARQAEAERLRRAKIIDAEGERQAAEQLVKAGKVVAEKPEAMQLRYLSALHAIASRNSRTIVLPISMDMVRRWHRFLKDRFRERG